MGSGRQLCHHLHELGPGFLVLLEYCRERHGGGAARRSPAPAASRRGARPAPYLAPPASDSWRPQLSAGHDLRGDAVRVRRASESAWKGRLRRPLGLQRRTVLFVYPRLPGNRPEPQRGGLAATVSLGRDVTVSGSRARLTGPRGTPPAGAPPTCQTRPAAARALHCRVSLSCWFGRPPAEQVLYKGTPDPRSCLTARKPSGPRSPTRWENPVEVRRDKETAQ